MDGDARGGAALSVVGVVGVPIAFAGSGERLQDLEPFHPDRVVSRVLGMGDVLSLIEKAEEAVSVEDAEKLEEKIRRNEFTLEDFRDQLRTIKKMGPLEQILGMLPGMGDLKQLTANREALDDKQLGRIEAMINSMTPKERRNHQLINGSRRKRIARGSGTSVEEVNRLLKQFVQMKKMLKQIGGHGRPGQEARRPGDDEVVDEIAQWQLPVQLQLQRSWKREAVGAERSWNERTHVSDSFAADGFEEARVFPRGGDRLAHGARQQLRGGARALQPADQAGDAELNRERLEHWVKAGAQPSDSVRTLVKRMPPAPAARGTARVVSRARDVVEVVARTLADHPDAVRVTEREQRGQTLRRAVHGAGRSRTRDRPPGADGAGDPHAGQRDRGARRHQGDARVPGPVARFEPGTTRWPTISCSWDAWRGRTAIAARSSSIPRPISPRNGSAPGETLLVGPRGHTVAAPHRRGAVPPGPADRRRSRASRR